MLIADDEILARETVKLLLSSVPEVTEVYEAENGNQARALANQHQPHIVILDIEMPSTVQTEVVFLSPKNTTQIIRRTCRLFVSRGGTLTNRAAV
jgi:DNA-binding NarL/FixJ family response regulator